MCGWLLDLIARLLVPDSALVIRHHASLGDLFGLARALDPDLTRAEWARRPPVRFWWLR